MNEILRRLDVLEKENKEIIKENKQMKLEMHTIKIRMDIMYTGWGKTKSDLAKLKIQLVQRNDLQKILKDRKRSNTVMTKFPETKPYFHKEKYGRSKLGARKQRLHETIGHDLIKQPGERNRITKWIENAEKKKTYSPDYMKSPATSIGSMKKNDVLMKTFMPIRKTREQHSASWKSSTTHGSSKKSHTPSGSQKSVSSKPKY